MEERLKLDLFGKDLSQIQRYSFEENMSFVNHEPNELTPMHQNLRRITVINDLSTIISQNKILEITNTHRNREVAEIETGYRLKNEAEDLEKSHEFIRAQKEEYEKLIELLKEAENDILEVMSGIENVDEPGEDDEHALLTHCFRELKDDLKYVLQTLCPEYKEDILNFLR
uniref:Uncharacterized protein n=2 Tax=Rhodnius prolixus TaxID=13249 RepID=T1ICR4_RHOPR